MNMDVKELPRIWQELDKMLVATIAGVVLTVALTAGLLPGAITAMADKRAVQAEYDQLQGSINQRTALLNAQPENLQQRIDEQRAQARNLAADMATAEQANAILASLYDKAGQAGVSVTRIDPIVELGNQDEQTPTAYTKQQVAVEVVGTAQNLIRFLELVADFGVDSYGIYNVTMMTDTNLILTFEVVGYTSDYAGQEQISSVSTWALTNKQAWG